MNASATRSLTAQSSSFEQLDHLVSILVRFHQKEIDSFSCQREISEWAKPLRIPDRSTWHGILNHAHTLAAGRIAQQASAIVPSAPAQITYAPTSQSQIVPSAPAAIVSQRSTLPEIVELGDSDQEIEQLGKTIEEMLVKLGKVSYVGREVGSRHHFLRFAVDRTVDAIKLLNSQETLETNLILHARLSENRRIRLVPVPGYLQVELERQAWSPLPLQKVDLAAIKEQCRQPSDFPLMFLGENSRGKSVSCELNRVLIAGETGSGKGMQVTCALLTLLYCYSRDRLRIVLIDTKNNTGEQLVPFKNSSSLMFRNRGLAHNPEMALGQLAALTEEMESRALLFQKHNVSDFLGFNRKKPNGSVLPWIVLFIEEGTDLCYYSDLASEITSSLGHIMRVGRSAGVSVVLSTQRLDQASFSGDIVANLNTRVVLKTSNGSNSALALGYSGSKAEKHQDGARLAGKGDALLSTSGKITRYQGWYIETENTLRVIAQLNQRDKVVADDDDGIFNSLFQ
jgi:hypothetical protein